MNRKIKCDQYELVVCFKTDNVLAISAEFSPTGEHFSNNNVELMRISKDTVLASLEKKSEKNLKCEFEQLVEEGKKSLQIVFIVNFDFLPEFREQIKLDYVQFKDSMKKVDFTNMRVEIEELNKALESIEKSGTTSHFLGTSNLILNEPKKEIWSTLVGEGKYILRVSGTLYNTQSYTADTMKFLISSSEDEKGEEIIISGPIQAGYITPFSFSTVVNCTQEGKLKSGVTSSVTTNYLYDLQFVLNKVAESC